MSANARALATANIGQHRPTARARPHTLVFLTPESEERERAICTHMHSASSASSVLRFVDSRNVPAVRDLSVSGGPPEFRRVIFNLLPHLDQLSQCHINHAVTDVQSAAPNCLVPLWSLVSGTALWRASRPLAPPRLRSSLRLRRPPWRPRRTWPCLAATRQRHEQRKA